MMIFFDKFSVQIYLTCNAVHFTKIYIDIGTSTRLLLCVAVARYKRKETNKRTQKIVITLVPTDSAQEVDLELR